MGVCALIQRHTYACNMCINWSFVINCQFSRIDHNLLTQARICSAPTVVVHNNHVTKNESFLACFMRILNSCVPCQVSNYQPWLPAIPAAYLLCSTVIRRDIRAA